MHRDKAERGRGCAPACLRRLSLPRARPLASLSVAARRLRRRRGGMSALNSNSAKGGVHWQKVVAGKDDKKATSRRTDALLCALAPSAVVDGTAFARKKLAVSSRTSLWFAIEAASSPVSRLAAVAPRPAAAGDAYSVHVKRALIHAVRPLPRGRGSRLSARVRGRAADLALPSQLKGGRRSPTEWYLTLCAPRLWSACAGLDTAVQSHTEFARHALVFACLDDAASVVDALLPPEVYALLVVELGWLQPEGVPWREPDCAPFAPDGLKERTSDVARLFWAHLSAAVPGRPDVASRGAWALLPPPGWALLSETGDTVNEVLSPFGTLPLLWCAETMECSTKRAEKRQREVAAYEKGSAPRQQPCTLAAGRSECLINPKGVPGGDMAGAGRVRLRRARALCQLFRARARCQLLRVEPSVARRACCTCSRLHREPLAALRVDGATVERACEAIGCLAPAMERPCRRARHAPPRAARRAWPLC